MPHRARVLFFAVFAVSCAGEPDIAPAASKPDGAATGDGSGGAGGGGAGSGGGGQGHRTRARAPAVREGGGASGAAGFGGSPDAGSDGALADGPGTADAPRNAGQLYAYVSGYAPTIAIYQVDDAGAFQAKGSAAARGVLRFSR